MSLEQSFRSLALRPAALCKNCRRAFSSSTRTSQTHSATVSFADTISNNRIAESTAAARTASAQPSTTAAAPDSRYASGIEYARQLVRESTTTRRAENARNEQLAQMRGELNRLDLDRQMTRRWRVGDVYAPHDLSGVEMSKWKKLRRKPKSKFDVMDQLGMNPLLHYRNFAVMSEYMSEMGRIKHSNETSLRPVNQRKMAKAVRRAIGMGLMPGVHRHPELLRAERDGQNRG